MGPVLDDINVFNMFRVDYSALLRPFIVCFRYDVCCYSPTHVYAS